MSARGPSSTESYEILELSPKLREDSTKLRSEIIEGHFESRQEDGRGHKKRLSTGHITGKQNKLTGVKEIQDQEVFHLRDSHASNDLGNK